MKIIRRIKYRLGQSKLVAFLILATAFYIVGSIIAWDYNLGNWHWFLRFFYAVGGILTAMGLINS